MWGVGTRMLALLSLPAEPERHIPLHQMCDRFCQQSRAEQSRAEQSTLQYRAEQSRAQRSAP